MFPLEVHLITDSQASILIWERSLKVVGMNDILKPNADIAMEIAHCRDTNKDSILKIHKVQSHIDESEAPDEVLWLINDEADKLATLTRERVRSGELVATRPGFLVGSQAMCIVGGVYCTTNLQESIFNRICQYKLQDFLCSKYGWNDTVFQSIDWEAYQTVLDRVQGLQKVTVQKYVHGWLANKQRRYCKGAYSLPQCELCQEIKDSQHIFCCQYSKMIEGQKRKFLKFKHCLRKITEDQVSTAIEAGIGGLGRETSGIYHDQFTTDSSVKKAFIEQDLIGWNHFVYGRIATLWAEVGPLNEKGKNDKTWAGRVARAVIDYGLALWRQRNTLVHGNDGGVSKQEIRKMLTTITTIYEELQPNVQPACRWYFRVSLESRIKEPYSVQVAWLDSIRQLCPERYTEISQMKGLTPHNNRDIERHKSARTVEY